MQSDKELIEVLEGYANDPMWADHAEVPKVLCTKAADTIASLRQQVERLEKEKANWHEEYLNAGADAMKFATRAERAEAELARLRTVDDAMIERAFYANHDPRAEPSSVERSKLRKAITAALEAKA